MKQAHASVMHYIVLAMILAGGIFAFYYVRGNTTLQLAIGIIVSISYVFWGIIHHLLDHSLHKRIVVEYLLIGAIAIVLLATIIRS
jgi:lipopolysaccharide export LptBFGC system permease protein LptF